MSQQPAVTTAEPRRAASSARSGVWRWIGIAVVSLAILGAVTLGLFITTVWLGGVAGTEFCPQTFERRTFTFFEIPWIGIQVTGIRRDDNTGLVELHIIKEKYVVPIETEPKIWHLATLYRTSGKTTTGDANLLLTYLSAKQEKGEPAWLNWSEDNPELAKVFWPVVAKAAREENYVVMPELFSQARSAGSAQELQKGLDAALAKHAKRG